MWYIAFVPILCIYLPIVLSIILRPNAEEVVTPTSTPVTTPTPPPSPETPGLLGGLDFYLIGSGGVGLTDQGVSVAFSADGTTLAVGGELDDSNVGATWIFVISDDKRTLVQQGPKLVGTGAVGPASQGLAVALSADGNTLAVGGYDDDSSIGATWIFTRSNDTWSQQGPKLVGTDAVLASVQGIAVALSSNGDTLAVGGFNDDTGVGATWIFTRTGTSWSQQGTKLVGTGASGAANQGYSVDLSADGNTLAVGGYNDDSGTGAIWIFTRSGETWSQQGTKLIGSGFVGLPNQGDAVALSSDGNILAVGGSTDNTNVGATWIFTRSGTTWSQQGSKLVGNGAVAAEPLQGVSLSINSEGNMIAVGSVSDEDGAWIFTRSGTTWSQQGSQIIPGSGLVKARSVSLAKDVDYLAVGVSEVTYVYTPPFPT